MEIFAQEFEPANYFQGRKWRVGRVGNCPPSFWQRKLTLKIKFWWFLLTHDQVNASSITKITSWLKFLGKNLHLVGCATVCSKSEVMLPWMYDNAGWYGPSLQVSATVSKMWMDTWLEICTYTYLSMTSLLAHIVAQPTKWRFLPKNLSQLVIFVIGLVYTWSWGDKNRVQF